MDSVHGHHHFLVFSLFKKSPRRVAPHNCFQHHPSSTTMHLPQHPTSTTNSKTLLFPTFICTCCLFRHFNMWESSSFSFVLASNLLRRKINLWSTLYIQSRICQLLLSVKRQLQVVSPCLSLQVKFVVVTRDLEPRDFDTRDMEACDFGTCGFVICGFGTRDLKGGKDIKSWNVRSRRRVVTWWDYVIAPSSVRTITWHTSKMAITPLLSFFLFTQVSVIQQIFLVISRVISARPSFLSWHRYSWLSLASYQLPLSSNRYFWSPLESYYPTSLPLSLNASFWVPLESSPVSVNREILLLVSRLKPHRLLPYMSNRLNPQGEDPLCENIWRRKMAVDRNMTL